MIDASDFTYFCERSIDFMAAGLGRLDEHTVNAKPDLPGSNSPAQLVTHALAACEWWTAHIILGDHVDRVRSEEFTTISTIAELVELTETTKARLRLLAPQLAQATELAFEPSPTSPLGTEWTVGLALMHVYEELAQHLGHLDITIDLVSKD